MKSFILIVSLVMAGAAQADLAADFKAMSEHRKGPFTVNWLQSSRGRTGVGGSVNDGCILARGGGGRFQFQAAFRNAIAQKLAAQDFYVGNLFTTNYYMLTGEYVFGDPCGSHEDDHRGLLNQAVKAMPKAASMARHWVLEKHYVHAFPTSGLYKGFKLRGISDSANEATYAVFFFNFYLAAMTQESQFLPAYLLVKSSPIGESTQIDRARQIVADSYDYFKARFCGAGAEGCSHPMVRRLYQLRNSVHNQLSLNIVGDIDRFFHDFPMYKKEGHTYLGEVQKILRAYYAFNVLKIAEAAGKAGLNEIKALAEQVNRAGASVESTLALSVAGAKLRSELANVPFEKKVYALLTISTITQYVNKEVNAMAEIRSKQPIEAMLNALYMEGFLIKSNWEYFVGELRGAADLKAVGAQLGDYVAIAQDTLVESFKGEGQSALDRWIKIEPKMASFVDNTIKSGSPNTLSVLANKLK